MRVWKSSSEPELPAPMPRRCPAPFAPCANWPVSKGPSSGWRDADVRLVTEKDGGMRLLEREAQAMMRAGWLPRWARLLCVRCPPQRR